MPVNIPTFRKPVASLFWDCDRFFMSEGLYFVHAETQKEEGENVRVYVDAVFVLNFDSKLLCKPDCKGLCCRCGKNLNDGPCDCRKEPDSRFAALQQLLNK